MAVVQKPINLLIFSEKSGLGMEAPFNMHQISENDHALPPVIEHQFAKKINATTISLPSSRKYISHFCSTTLLARCQFSVRDVRCGILIRVASWAGEESIAILFVHQVTLRIGKKIECYYIRTDSYNYFFQTPFPAFRYNRNWKECNLLIRANYYGL